MSLAKDPTKRGERALIFDMDGVLIDSEPLWRRAEIDVFREVGLDLEDADCLQTQGLRIDEAVQFWYERAPWADRSIGDVAKSIVLRMAGLIRSEGEPMPGALTSIGWAANSTWRLALASSSSKFLIDIVLDRFGITNLFELTRSAEDEASGKPHPDVYLSVARDLQLNPRACVAVEDSVNGMVSALSAGMRCIAVPPPETRDDGRFASANLLLNSLRDLPKALEKLADSCPRGV